MTLTENEAYQLLNSPTHCKAVPGAKQFVRVKNGRAYAFQPDNTGPYHGDEISAGDESEVRKRFELVRSLEVLAASPDAETLTAAIIETGILPPKAVRDAAHVAVTTVHGVEYLLTWNCRHLANAQISRRVALVCTEYGFAMPTIFIPEELFGETDDE